MSEVKLSVLAISVSLIIVGFIIKLAPFGKGQKMIKGLLSLIIVLIITAPLTKAVNIDADINISSNKTEVNKYDGLIESTTINLLKSRIEAVLNSNKISYTYVDITVINNIDKVEISAITVYVDNELEISKIKTAVRKELQLDVAVAVERRN